MKSTIDNFDLQDIPRVTLFLNHYSLLRLAEEKFFDRMSRSALLGQRALKIHIDGGLFVRHLRWFGVRVNRYSFDWSSIAGPLFEHLSATGEPVSFIGGSPDEAKLFREVIGDRFPKLALACHDGYSEAQPAFASLAAPAGHGYVVFGMGTPLQEKLALELAETNPALKVMTCGGFITQTAQFGDIYGGAWRFLPRFVVRAIRQKHVLGRILKDYPKAFVKATVWGMSGQNIFATRT